MGSGWAQCFREAIGTPGLRKTAALACRGTPGGSGEEWAQPSRTRLVWGDWVEKQAAEGAPWPETQSFNSQPRVVL